MGDGWLTCGSGGQRRDGERGAGERADRWARGDAGACAGEQERGADRAEWRGVAALGRGWAGRGGGFWAGSGGREAGWVLFGSGLVVGLLWVFTFLFLFLFYVSLKLNLFEFKNKFRIQTPMKSNN